MQRASHGSVAYFGVLDLCVGHLVKLTLRKVFLVVILIVVFFFFEVLTHLRENAGARLKNF